MSDNRTLRPASGLKRNPCLALTLTIKQHSLQKDRLRPRSVPGPDPNPAFK